MRKEHGDIVQSNLVEVSVSEKGLYIICIQEKTWHHGGNDDESSNLEILAQIVRLKLEPIYEHEIMNAWNAMMIPNDSWVEATNQYFL